MLKRGRISFFVVFAVGLGLGLIELRALKRHHDSLNTGGLRDRHLRALAESS